ncbi:cytochrome P450 [Stipitochalara longipes BDJ]|nr:cytochrome P450 [Stipitochalara longipes BDJ]
MNPQPTLAGWSWLAGHTLVLLRYSSRLPPLANVALVLQDMLREFPESEMFLLDLWPSYPPVIINCNPEVGLAVSQKYNLPKSPTLEEAVRPIVGGPSILSMNGSDWKTWRSRFNPGFSAASLMGHVPYIVDRVQVFCEKLQANVGRDIIFLDDFATRLTFEIIMKVSLDADINYQHEEHLLSTSLNTITRWHSFWDPRILLHPLRPFVQWYHGNIIKKYIRKELEQRFAELKAERLESETVAKKANSVIALALEAYISESEDKRILERPRLDDEFAATVTQQIRLFLLAGNDTTASTIVFMYHLISKHPAARAQLRAEHDAIFGQDISNAAELLKQQPALLNQCRYTLAVIKETLRIYPPAVTMRQGVPGFSITTLDGVSLPTEDVRIITNTWAVHQNPRIWVRPDDFIPERWLANSGDELYPLPGAYRPFDLGPRVCLGQTLSLNELRVVLIMTARSFVVEPAYEEWDMLQARNAGLWTKVANWTGRKEIDTVKGDRAFQTELAGSHPSDGYPCRVSLAE